MATFNRFNHLGSANGFDKRDPREDTIRRPAEEAQERIASVGVDTLALLAALPRAFARSQQRELKRLLSTGKDEKDPRVVALRSSLERTGVLLETAAIGQARIDRMLEPTDRSVVTFSGFVSDDALRPRAGLRVQVSEPQGASLSAVTDASGYFSIVIGKNSNSFVRRDAGIVGAMLGAKADPKNEAAKAEAARAAAAAQPAATTAPIERVGKVEIFDANGKQVLHEDPQPLPLYGNTNLYREYVVGSDSDGGTKPFRDGGSTIFGGVRDRDPGGVDAGGIAAPSEPATPAVGTKPAPADASAKPASSTSRPSRPAADKPTEPTPPAKPDPASVATPPIATPADLAAASTPASPARPESAVAKPQGTKPEAAKPEAAKPEAAKPDATAPATGRPGPARAGATRPAPAARPARTKTDPTAPGSGGRKKP